MNNDLENFINSNRHAFDRRIPDPAVLERIQQQMMTGNKKKQETIVLPMRMVKWAAACCILLAGAAIFWMMEKEPAQKQTARTVAEKPVKVPETTEPVTEMAAIDQPAKKEAFTAAEPSAQKQVLFAKLNDMESTSQRLKAAAAFDRITNTDHDIVDALVKTMNTDPSTNVRLAALDALGKFSKETYVKKKLLAALGKQTDPMVQISLIELLTRMRESSILQELDKLVNDGNTMDAVKDRAYSSIFKLRSS